MQGEEACAFSIGVDPLLQATLQAVTGEVIRIGKSAQACLCAAISGNRDNVNVGIEYSIDNYNLRELICDIFAQPCVSSSSSSAH